MDVSYREYLIKFQGQFTVMEKLGFIKCMSTLPLNNMLSLLFQICFV